MEQLVFVNRIARGGSQAGGAGFHFDIKFSALAFAVAQAVISSRLDFYGFSGGNSGVQGLVSRLAGIGLVSLKSSSDAGSTVFREIAHIRTGALAQFVHFCLDGACLLKDGVAVHFRIIAVGRVSNVFYAVVLIYNRVIAAVGGLFV